jgi:hypothetical protein
MKNFVETALIIEKHFKSSKSAVACAFMAMELAPYYTKLAWLDANHPEIVAETILHDYQGLKSDCDHFVPRLA